ncbi:hypothetical protein BN2497_3145 [Janthinobacterium sp. CG23_2]|nr:hypothetical protein BN2497_3145 [Janthinobacterium sp. CG23_2]CUU27970.1 hypothetical protein BN3177_3145 [Janthinobacterium sp. CG23_2]
MSGSFGQFNVGSNNPRRFDWLQREVSVPAHGLGKIFAEAS